MLFEDNDFDINMTLFIPDLSMGRTDKIHSPYEGFIRGNMFKDEYIPYKNMTYFKLVPTTEKEKHLYKIMALEFAINDLNLFLDLHPDDKEMFNSFKKFVSEEKSLCEEFERKYGPLKLEATVGSKYNWIDNPWPWDNVGGNKYV